MNATRLPAVETPSVYVIIADPESMRWQHYRRAIDSLGPPIDTVLLPWRDVLERDGQIEELLPKAPSLLRVESPARDFSLVRALMRAGQREEGQAPSAWEPPAKGWLASPRLLYRGLRRILTHVSQSVRHHPRCVLASNLEDTVTLFDKNAVTQRLRSADIPTPEAFAPESRDQMLQELERRKWRSAFIKLAYGSCASGIARIELTSDGMRGETTVVELEGQFHNSRRIAEPSAAKLARLVDFLISERATVQASIPKTRVLGDEFDVRVVVVAGEVVATVFRASHKPMTNLHLGGYRADPRQCRQAIPERAWADAMDHCRHAASLFNLAAVGIDLAFSRPMGEPSIIEMNAFGDFFPNWKNKHGRSISELEIEATLRRHGVQIG